MDAERREWIKRWTNGWKEVLDERADDPSNLYPDMALGTACDMILELLAEGREDLAVTRSASSPSDPKESGKGARPKSVPEDGNIGSDDARSSVLSPAHRDVIARLVVLFRTRQDDLDLALMKVIAEGGSPAEWLVGMLQASLPAEPAETSPRPRFLGEG